MSFLYPFRQHASDQDAEHQRAEHAGQRVSDDALFGFLGDVGDLARQPAQLLGETGGAGLDRLLGLAAPLLAAACSARIAAISRRSASISA